MVVAAFDARVVFNNRFAVDAFGNRHFVGTAFRRQFIAVGAVSWGSHSSSRYQRGAGFFFRTAEN